MQLAMGWTVPRLFRRRGWKFSRAVNSSFSPLFRLDRGTRATCHRRDALFLNLGSQIPYGVILYTLRRDTDPGSDLKAFSGSIHFL